MRLTTPLSLLSLALLLTACAAEPPRTRPAPAPQRSAAPTPASPATSAVKPQPAQRAPATGTPEDARRHLVRGNAAIEMAKSDGEFAIAEEEFRIATEIDPTMAPAWFNLGTVQSRLGKFDEAMAAYRRYLALAPDAQDAPRVRDEIIKLEFRQEQQAKTRGRAGAWVTEDGTPYTVTVQGDRLTMETQARAVREDEVVSTYSLVGTVHISRSEHHKYDLVLRGNRVTGLWTRDEIIADKCKVPGEAVEVTGELNDRDRTLTVRYPRTTYRAHTQMALFPDDYCAEVVVTGKKDVEERFYGPLPAGGLDVLFAGVMQYWEGGFSSVDYGWKGRLHVKVSPESTAFQAGLADDDELLAIDGVPINTLTAGQTLLRLRGEPGSKVTVTVAREDVDAPFEVTLTRVETPLSVQ